MYLQDRSGHQIHMGWNGPLSRVINPGKPIYKAIYRAYNPIYNWWRGPSCRDTNNYKQGTILNKLVPRI